jgi:molecular chaperone HscC
MIVGIDLGTTNSLVAVWQDGAARLIPNGLGEVLTPSCVSLDEDGSVLVGRAARERLQTHPDRSASVFKRYMGSNKTLRLGKKDFRAEELSSLVLRSLRADAEAALGEPVTEAVITVPAYFSDAQRKATRLAGEMAGLKVERLLNEPTAAALAYGMHQLGSESRFLVFDLGGGTFDVSILELFEGVMEVRSSAGDNFLGGEDVVLALVDLFFERHKLSERLRQDGLFMQRLLAEAEAAKCLLSHKPSATLRMWRGDNELTLDLDEALLEKTCESLLKRLRAPVERALRDASLRSAQLDNIVLAGGATRMPLVRKLVTTMFGRFPAVDLNPDEIVALGAAVQAGLKARDAALKEVVMTDVAPYSLGVEVSQHVAGNTFTPGHFDPVIERNTTVPVSRVKTYHPLRDGSRKLELKVYQGEARLVKDNIHLGELQIPLPGLPSHESGIDVRFTYDVNGLLEVEVSVLKTGQTQRLLIEGNPGALSQSEIDERLAALAALKIHPRNELANRTLLAQAERLFQQLRGEVRDALGQRIRLFEHALSLQNSSHIDEEHRILAEWVKRIEQDGRLHDSGDPAPLH